MLGEDYGADVDEVKVELRFPDEEGSRNADIVHYDIKQDIALLKASSLEDRRAFEFYGGDPYYGQRCYAVGNAHGYGISILEGIVSIPSIYVTVDGGEQEYIQANIDIYQGSSGGALLTEDGKLLGMTSFRLLEGDGDPVYGFGYSIPSSRLQLALSDCRNGLA